jgi:S1-C subfamily serine protease
VLDEAIFTAPAHPNWGGTALIGPAGDLLGIGSLQLERARERGSNEHLNMIVPIDDLKPILDDLMKVRQAEPAAAAVARSLCHRGRGQDRRGRPRVARPRAGGRHPHRRHHSGGRRPRGE